MRMVTSDRRFCNVFVTSRDTEEDRPRRPVTLVSAGADDAEERNRPRGGCQRQRSRRSSAGRDRADAALPAAGSAAAFDEAAARAGLRLDPDCAARRRRRPRRRPLPVRAPDAERTRTALEVGQGVDEVPAHRSAVAAGHGSPHRLRRTRGRRLVRRGGVALGHDHARPRRSSAEHAVPLLVPARPRRPDLLQGPDDPDHHRPHQQRVDELWAYGDAEHGGEADGHQRQLLDHDRLPRLQVARQQAARRVHGRRPPLPEHGRRPGRLRDDRPRARLPETQRPAGARLRALPAHGQRPLSRRSPAALHRGAQRPALDGGLDLPDPEADRCAQGQRRDRQRELRHLPAELLRDRVVRGPRVQAAAGPPVPRRAAESAAVRDRERRADRADAGHPDRGDLVRESRRDAGGALDRRRARTQGQAAEGAAAQVEPDLDGRPQRDDDPGACARHVVQAVGGRLPYRPTAGERARRRAEPGLLRDDRLLRRRAGEREAGGARAEDGVRRAYDDRAAAARALRVRATGGESADRNRRRLELQRTAQQSAGARGANPAAPDGGGAQRGEPDDLLARAGSVEGAVPRPRPHVGGAELAAGLPRPGAGLQADPVSPRAGADLRDRGGQRLLAGDRDRLDGRAGAPPPDVVRAHRAAARTGSTRPAGTST